MKRTPYKRNQRSLTKQIRKKKRTMNLPKEMMNGKYVKTKQKQDHQTKIKIIHKRVITDLVVSTYQKMKTQR